MKPLRDLCVAAWMLCRVLGGLLAETFEAALLYADSHVQAPGEWP